MKKIVPKKLDLTEDSKAKFFAETIARHFTEEVMNFPKVDKETNPKLPTTINLTEKVRANWSVLSIIASEVKQAKEAERS